jgi:hypothetical protein
LLVGSPGSIPTVYSHSAAPVYKTEPHASADAVQGMRDIVFIARRKWSEWLDSDQRPLRSERRALPRLRYTPEMAAVRRFGITPVADCLVAVYPAMPQKD